MSFKLARLEHVGTVWKQLKLTIYKDLN